MFLGYNTNGFAHHRLGDAVAILAELGYQGIAITPDVHHLDPYAEDHRQQWEAFRVAHQSRNLRWVVETGARFVIDPRRKHQPTLLSPDSADVQRRVDFLCRCIHMAQHLEAEGVSLWSGAAHPERTQEQQMRQLVEQLQRLADLAASHEQRLAFEPEPGMFIDTLEKFAELYERVHHPAFGLTLDIGHLICQGELPASQYLMQWKEVLWNVHIEDMRAGVHDHVLFGEGEVDFSDVFAGLRAADYRGGVYVELSRHSHAAVATAQKSLDFLMPFLSPL
ncbi:MAG: sugar phosphate isomerase/epimerase [Bacteroidales bacterium]|nr:sugar phosphate isomerase/epimerase [Bacteroidales bacterium]